MQFYLNGYQTGDPEIAPADSTNVWSPELPEQVDVLIAGSGPAGVMIAAQLSTEPSITTRVIERRKGPLEIGQADGIAARSVELFDTFGIADKLVREAYWVNETVFWRPSETDRHSIVRTGRIQDTADDLSEFPHVIVNQARLQQYFLDYMKESTTKLEPDYGYEIVGVEVAESGEYPVTVSLKHADTGAEKTIQAKYVVGCDGARSVVRESIGRKLVGDFANHAWGVMDILGNTDFPDIRLKSVIQAADDGNILIIPREGSYLFRVYVDLGEVDPNDREKVRSQSLEDVLAVANRVMSPYTIEAKEVAWFSIYEVGQRVADGFDDVPAELIGQRYPRVFIAGDACHTHSAKAGQGMNVSMPDTNNLAWKLISVLKGRATEELLYTYAAERRPIAQRLIDFDKEWSAMMAAGPIDPEHPERGGVDPDVLQTYFEQSGKFTAGTATHYPPATYLTQPDTHQALATGFTVGMRFHSAPVIRLADAKRVQLGHAHRADGAFRIYAFADASGDKFADLMDFLGTSPESPVTKYLAAGADPDSVVDVRGIYPQYHRDVRIEDQPAVLRPKKGKYGLVDSQKIYTVDHKTGPDIYDFRGVNREQGALVLVRPDQYIATVLPLDDHAALTAYFDAFYLPAK